MNVNNTGFKRLKKNHFASLIRKKNTVCFGFVTLDINVFMRKL